MAERVYFHIGLPKTGTTYLQSVLWANAPELRRQGLLLPGESVRQHLWATLVVRERRGARSLTPAVAESWTGLIREVEAWPGNALISHEFFGAATQQQASRCVAQLGGSSVTVIITARDLLSIVTSRWQEYVKHGFAVPLDEFPATTDSTNEWSFDAIDVGSMVSRWSMAVASQEQLRILVLPEAGAPPEALLQSFASLIEVDPTNLDTERARDNRSLGVVEAELMRRIGPQLTSFASARDRGVWQRSYLAQGKLVPLGGERFQPSDQRIAELRAMAADSVEFVRGSGVDVIGDLDRLLVPEDLPTRRHPSSVTDSELLQASTETIAAMMVDIRALREHNTAMRKAAEETLPPQSATPAPVSLPRRVVRGTRGRLRRDSAR